MARKKINKIKNDFKIGDSVSYHGKKFPNHKNSKKLFHATGLITRDYVIQSKKASRGFVYVENRNKCKTTFSFKYGGGHKIFYKRNLRNCRVILCEKVFFS